MNILKRRTGFTLIELLVVIAIIAILSVVVVLSLNPAELLRQSRDSNRISDLSTMKSAISIYLADVSSTALGTAGTCYTALSTTTYWTPNPTNTVAATTTCAAWFSTATGSSTASGTIRGVTGSNTGWIPVNFSLISSGAPIGQEPIDPANVPGTGTGNSKGFFYSYIETGNTSFKMAAKMESVKFAASGTADVESTDGGSNNYMLEQGSNLAL